MKTAILVNAMIIAGSILTAGNALAVENKGAASIVLNGGAMGSVTFPHGLHQDVFIDCKPCHELFGKESKSIEKLKAAGKLQKKEVMNMCNKCHTDLAAKGKKAGPTSCKACHKK